MTGHTSERGGATWAPAPALATDLNKVRMNIQGDRVQVSGLFDLKGLRMLEKKIACLKALLASDEELQEVRVATTGDKSNDRPYQ